MRYFSSVTRHQLKKEINHIDGSNKYREGNMNIEKGTILEKKVLYRTLKGSISTTYLEPLIGYIHS